MDRLRDRGALVLAYLEDLAKVTGMRLLVPYAQLALMLFAPEPLSTSYFDAANWLFRPVGDVMWSYGISRMDVFWYWVSMPIYLTWIYRSYSDYSNGGPRSLSRRGFSRRPASPLIILARNVPGALFAFPPACSSDGQVSARQPRGPALVVIAATWLFDMLFSMLR